MIQIGHHPALQPQGAQRARVVCRQRHCGYLEAGSPESGLAQGSEPSARATNDPPQLTINPGFCYWRDSRPCTTQRILALTCLPPAPGAGLPASPLRGRITRPDVRVSLRTSPRPAPRPRASSSRGRTTSGARRPPPPLRDRRCPARRLPPPIMSVAGLKKQFHKATQVGRVQVRRGGPCAFPGRVGSPRAATGLLGSGTRLPGSAGSAIPDPESWRPHPSFLLQPRVPAIPSTLAPCPWRHRSPSPQSQVPTRVLRRSVPAGQLRALHRGGRAGAWWRGGRLCKVASAR